MIRRASAPHKLRCGLLISTPMDSDKGVVERELIQCCHCQFTCVWTPGVERGWAVCGRCNDWHCPKVECRSGCRPWRQWLENRRLGLADDHVPIVGRVEAEPPRG